MSPYGVAGPKCRKNKQTNKQKTQTNRDFFSKVAAILQRSQYLDRWSYVTRASGDIRNWNIAIFHDSETPAIHDVSLSIYVI